MLDLKQIEQAINIISAEKKIAKEKLVEIIEAAIKTAYKKDYGNRDEEVNVKLDIPNQRIEITVEKTVVKEVTNPSLEISFEELGDDAENFSYKNRRYPKLSGELTFVSKNFCIIKIWMSDCSHQNPGVITLDVKGLTAQGCLFKKHTPEY